MPFAGIVKMFSSTNPAELIVRLLQQLTWTLLLLLKAIGVTLFGSVVSLEGAQGARGTVPRHMRGDRP